MPKNPIKKENYIDKYCKNCKAKFFAATIRAEYCSDYCKLKYFRGNMNKSHGGPKLFKQLDEGGPGVSRV